MTTECPNCRHLFNPQNETHTHTANGPNLCQRILFALIILLIPLAFVGYLLYDSFYAIPPSKINFTAMGLTAQGLNPNSTSHTVFEVIFKYSGSRDAFGNSICLDRGMISVSYNGLTLAKEFEVGLMNYCRDTYEFPTVEVTGPAASLPSSVDKQKASFDVDMDLAEEKMTRTNIYHVSCKGLALQMNVPVLCETTLNAKS